ncbi:MAG: transglutaminase-like domain-containing protein [Candidatus Sumerlaeales bacterium]|nr:transglutaminase-like domain-containing protein [Candidatus Sumerlaeales bacterium]
MKKYLVTFIIAIMLSAYDSQAKESLDMFSSFMVGLDLPAELSKLEEKGEISAAMAWIEKNDAKKYVVEHERLRRMKRDYKMTADEMLAKIKLDVPDVTMADLERWTSAGVIMTEPVDGTLRYFRREPSNLWRRCKEARDMKEKVQARKTNVADPAAAENMSRKDCVENIVAGKDLYTRTFKVKHVITIPGGTVPEGEEISCWIPLPQDYRHQTGPSKLVTSPAEHQWDSKSTATMRTMFMTQKSKGDKPTVFKAEYEYSMKPFYPTLDFDKATIDKNDPLYAKYTQAFPPHILVNDEVTKLAKSIVGETTNPLTQALTLWRWMQDNIQYDSEREYSTIPSATRKIMSTRSGDCGIQALMFISMCRSLGIPARWQSGWVTMPGNWNMHDWAEINIQPYGWLPVDPSIGYIKSDNPKVHDFLFGGMEPYRGILNTECAVDFVPPTLHWRSDPVDNQVGEVQWKGGNLFYDQWEYDVTAEEVMK